MPIRGEEMRLLLYGCVIIVTIVNVMQYTWEHSVSAAVARPTPIKTPVTFTNYQRGRGRRRGREREREGEGEGGDGDLMSEVIKTELAYRIS